MSEDAPDSWARRFTRWILVSDMSRSGFVYQPEEYPDELNTWILFRRLVDVILFNDLAMYVLLAIREYEPPAPCALGQESTLANPCGWLSWWCIARHVIGVILCLIALWGKSDAYRVVKEFAWYWGDFFFLIDQKLTFDRVFAMAPHPMYTVGYLFMYGSALITHSYTILLYSLFAHACQLIFLEMVENPHIERTYAGIVDSDEVPEEAPTDMVVLSNFTPYRASDMLTVALLAMHTIIFMLADGTTGDWLLCALAIGWRLAHCGLAGYALARQSTSNAWLINAVNSGAAATVDDAFVEFKRIFNASLVITNYAFITVFLHFYQSSATSYVHLTIGAVLVALNVWSAVSVHHALGHQGYFYQDFFSQSAAHITYDGIYRFLNNPESVLGFSAYYGAAIAAGSWEVFWIALLSHSVQWLFIRLVETPHMRRRYGDAVRERAGTEEALRSMLFDSDK
jgi:phosphatidylethanolamine N-methyltransferase